MGIVHLARKGEDGPRVAFKVLRPHVVGDAEARRRLAQEVSALQRVDSPRIAGFIDADPFGDTPYVVTRYVPGYSLNRYVEEEGVVAGPDLVHLATCLAEALEAVHAVGVLHRDVKPSNVLMEGRTPVLIDFGLARAAEDPTLTATGFMLGTPGYLPPEVVYGEPATAAGDVYAWAATVAFAATGRPPFGRGHAMAVLDRVRRGDHDLDGVPAELSGLLHACLAVEPGDRPSVDRVLARLRELAPTGRGGEPGGAAAADLPTDAWTRPVSHLEDGPTGPDDAATAVTAPVAAEPRADDGRDERHDEPLTALLTSPVFEPAPPARNRGEKALRVLQRLTLGALLVAFVAAAPYVALLTLGLLAWLLRTASITRQRHLRRRLVRGRPRWYDVPTTTLSMPGYLLLAAGGAVVLLFVAGMIGLGVLAVATLSGQSETNAVLLAAVVVVPLLWRGPGSSRVRELVVPLLDRGSRAPRVAVAVVVVALILALGTFAAVTVGGPSWYPQPAAPWK